MSRRRDVGPNLITSEIRRCHFYEYISRTCRFKGQRKEMQDIRATSSTLDISRGSIQVINDRRVISDKDFMERLSALFGASPSAVFPDGGYVRSSLARRALPSDETDGLVILVEKSRTTGLSTDAQLRSGVITGVLRWARVLSSVRVSPKTHGLSGSLEDVGERAR